MRKKSLRDHVTQFYKKRSLPDAKVRRLVGLAQQPTLKGSSPMRPSYKFLRPAAMMGLAASIALLMVATVLYLRSGHVTSNGTVQQSMSVGHGELVADPLSADLVTPRLVAVKIHADWCARTPEVAPIFDDMTTKYGNQPILFVTLDITDDTGRRQARYLTENLGISSVYDDPFESGMVKLIDRQDGQVLAVLTGEEQRPRMEGALAQALPSHP
ncbi:MAG: hypothetical protein KAY32_03310 [Candidatus Eisenbacteria sp.]|nr:hypothetical protein [Candidatus Eisenbacteria bacterium]